MNKTFILTIFHNDETAEPQQEYFNYASAEFSAKRAMKKENVSEISIDCFWDDPDTGEEKSINRFHWKK